MANSLLQKYQEIDLQLKEPLEESDILSNLKKSDSLLTSGFPDSSYVAFHFRSPFVEEGRASNCYQLGEGIQDNIIRRSYRTTKMTRSPSYKEFKNRFIESLLNCYLYVFGRDVSLSENCILQAERQNDISATEKDIFLTILLNEKTEKELKEIMKPVDSLILIPFKYYECLTQSTGKRQHRIPYLLYNKVLDCMLKKTNKKDPFLLNSISDYRKVLHCLENTTKQRFTELQNRGIEVALYYASQEKPASPILQSANRFKKYVNQGQGTDDQLRFFFRVIQAACIFTPLLGESLSISSFPTYDQKKSSLTPVVNKRIAGVIHTSKTWSKLDAGLSKYLKDNHQTKSYSSLVVYGLNDYGQDRQKKHLINALRYLSFYFYCLPFGNETYGNNWVKILRVFLKQDGKSKNQNGDTKDQGQEPEIVKKRLEEVNSKSEELLGETFYWPIVAMIGADTLRGIKHENQGACINLAIGTDVEFREVLTPIFNISDSDPFNVSLTDLRAFQEQLRNLIKRHFYLINVPNRYICLKIEKGKVKIHNISDLRSDYHANAFSEVVKNIIPKSGLTIARIDSFGKANVCSRTRDNKYKLIFKCDAHDYWEQMVLDGDKKHSISLSDMAKAIADLKQGDDVWKHFVEYLLKPIVEVVSENPLEGAAIVIAKTKRDIEHAISSMPITTKFKVDHSPTNQVQYVDKESFRSHIVQDGATVVYYKDGKIDPRIQLKGRVKKKAGIKKKQKKKVRKTEKYFEDIIKMDQFLNDKQTMWGTRHLSCLHFIGEMMETNKKVFCIIVSQDGDVHFLRSDPKNKLCRHVTIG